MDFISAGSCSHKGLIFSIRREKPNSIQPLIFVTL